MRCLSDGCWGDLFWRLGLWLLPCLPGKIQHGFVSDAVVFSYLMCVWSQLWWLYLLGAGQTPSPLPNLRALSHALRKLQFGSSKTFRWLQNFHTAGVQWCLTWDFSWMSMMPHLNWFYDHSPTKFWSWLEKTSRIVRSNHEPIPTHRIVEFWNHWGWKWPLRCACFESPSGHRRDPAIASHSRLLGCMEEPRNPSRIIMQATRFWSAAKAVRGHLFSKG